MLEAGGYGVHTVDSGVQALEWLRLARYDVVVCDVAMTPMDGFVFVEAVRSRPEFAATCIVLVSALDDDELHTHGAACGADACLTKRDCASGRLLAVVAEVTSKRRSVA